MPGLYEIALLCESVYKQQNLTLNWKDLTFAQGERNISEGQTGYFGQAFINEATNEIVMVHRGTKIYGVEQKFEVNPDNQKLYAFTSYGNLYNDFRLALKFVPPEIEPALRFAFLIKEKYPKHRIIQAGHSLGGFEANIVGYFCQQEVVGFDPPGCLQQLKEMTREVLNEDQLKRHYNFLAQSDLVNACNTQVGNVYYRKPFNNDWLPIQDQGSTEAVKITLQNHPIQTFLDCIPKNSPDPTKGIPDIFVLPEVYKKKGNRQLREESITGKKYEGQVLQQMSESFESIINPPLTLMKEKWMASLINSVGGTDGIIGGHAVIVIEGILSNGKRFFGEYDITANADPAQQSLLQNLLGNTQGFITNIRCNPSADIRKSENPVAAQPKRDYSKISPHSKVSWYVTPQEANKIIEGIENDAAILENAKRIAREQNKEVDWPFKYQKGGKSRLGIFGSNEGHNCVTWCEEKLALGNIVNGVLPLDLIKAMPLKHTFTK